MTMLDVDVVASLAQQRIVAGAAATLEVFFTDQNGEPASASGTVTVKVTRADGTVVLAANTATVDHTSEADGRYTVSLPGSEATRLDLLTATWSVTGTPAKTTLIEVVGGVYFTAAEARDRIATLTEDAYPLADVLDARRDVETEFERICGGAFVPRYRRIRIDSAGSTCLQLPDPLLRAVREVSPPGAATFDSGELAAIRTSLSGELAQDAAFPSFAQGIVGYEHGLDRPPPAIKTVALERLREVLNIDSAGVDARTTSYSVDGVTYTLGGPDERSTGNPTIDAVLARYNYRELTGG